ncbi:g-type lysozyme inhibitor [Stenotrophomonas rhizophila]|uniref:g-type lysozyme inhibitor n=1 Tax=Stenotrophomonas rhizophila TaxID=216778 RepID=UPI0010BFEBF2|nr:g-type lysozyme inhibitor [Stenotrophomonas rhizophila]TKK09239.1 g-type lysozyme inhibitor [Stenotrophomonas rhizophila]
MAPFRSILLTALLALAPTLAGAADKVTTTPVQFAKGTSSATLRGTVAGYDTVRYTVGARAGQTMTVTLAGSANASFNVYAPGVVPGQGEALGSTDEKRRWTGTLPASGTYVVQVYQMRAQARRGEKAPHTLTVAIH